MAECIKQTEESKMEGLLREGVHKEIAYMQQGAVNEVICAIKEMDGIDILQLRIELRQAGYKF